MEERSGPAEEGDMIGGVATGGVANGGGTNISINFKKYLRKREQQHVLMYKRYNNLWSHDIYITSCDYHMMLTNVSKCWKDLKAAMTPVLWQGGKVIWCLLREARSSLRL